MALLKKDIFTSEVISRPTIHQPAKGTYSILEINGKHFFQISTYGRSNRENPDSKSQVIQLDEEMAYEMYKLLRKTFGFN